MKHEARLVAPGLEIPSVLKNVKVLRFPSKPPRYYKRKVRQMKRGL